MTGRFSIAVVASSPSLFVTLFRTSYEGHRVALVDPGKATRGVRATYGGVAKCRHSKQLRFLCS